MKRSQGADVHTSWGTLLVCGVVTSAGGFLVAGEWTKAGGIFAIAAAIAVVPGLLRSARTTVTAVAAAALAAYLALT